METFSTLLSICTGNSPVPGELPSQRPMMLGFDVFIDLLLNKQLNKQSYGWWFETPSYSLWRHCNVLYTQHISTNIAIITTQLYVWVQLKWTKVYLYSSHSLSILARSPVFFRNCSTRKLVRVSGALRTQYDTLSAIQFSCFIECVTKKFLSSAKEPYFILNKNTLGHVLSLSNLNQYTATLNAVSGNWPNGLQCQGEWAPFSIPVETIPWCTLVPIWWLKLKSITRYCVERSNFQKFWVKMAKMTLKIKVNDPHFQYQLRIGMMDVWCKFCWFQPKSVASYRAGKPNFLQLRDKMAKMTSWRSRSMTPFSTPAYM